jgi:hypothetical protein
MFDVCFPRTVFSLGTFLQKAGAWPLVGLIVVGVIVLALLAGRGASPKPRSDRGVSRNIRTAGSAKVPEQTDEAEKK